MHRLAKCLVERMEGCIRERIGNCIIKWMIAKKLNWNKRWMNHSWMNDRILAWKDQFIWKSFGKTKCSVHELCENEMQKWMNDELSWHCCVVQTKATSLSRMDGWMRGETKKFFRLILREPQRRLNFDNDAGCGKEGRSSLSAKPSDQRETRKLRGFVGRWFDFQQNVVRCNNEQRCCYLIQRSRLNRIERVWPIASKN